MNTFLYSVFVDLSKFEMNIAKKIYIVFFLLNLRAKMAKFKKILRITSC